MAGIVWVLLVVFVIAFNWNYYYSRKILDATLTTLFSLVTATVVIAIVCGVASNYPKDVTSKLWRTTNIYSLKDAGTTYKGSFVLGSGSIDNTAYYTVYVQTADGFYKEKFKQGITYIKEVEGVTPTVEKYVTVTTLNKVEGWLLGKQIQNGCCYTKYILYVPRGTIIKRFRLE